VGASSITQVIIRNIGASGDLIGDVSLTNNQSGIAFTISAPEHFDIPAHKMLSETVTFTPDAMMGSATITVPATTQPKARSTFS
jgi:hypothetical protein